MSEFIQGHWHFLIAFSVIGALIVLVQIILRARRMPYEARGRLLTSAELSFFQSLREAAGDDFSVFPMVRIADLLRVKKGAQQYMSWQNRISARHVDFVLCDPETLTPTLAIELDDESDERPDQTRQDQFVDSAFDAAGLELLRIETMPSYDAEHVRQLIDARIA